MRERAPAGRSTDAAAPALLLQPRRRTLLAVIPFIVALPGRTAGREFDHEHAAWTVLLRRHVRLADAGRASRVDYAGMQRDRAALNSYLDTLAAVGRREFDAWTRPRRMAFLVNTYNARTVEKVLSRYPDIRSIWDFGKIFGNPFRDRFFRLFGEPASLDDIEHDTLRAPGAYDEPRVHFAVNCASVGCPLLREEAYTGARLPEQLEDQTRRFLSPARAARELHECSTTISSRKLVPRARGPTPKLAASVCPRSANVRRVPRSEPRRTRGPVTSNGTYSRE